ncbi:MAG: SDR family NAD(P)-dependent oxidoreductase [Elusimicrobia bacterium]|nr:SDR family NAD(P)-dependent oxidoreductase [Elusimicrobiota bacterium]
MDIKGKVVIVTGASSGIGLETAKLLAKHGAKLALVARSKDKLEILSKELQGSAAISADMSKENDIGKMIKKVIDKFGRIDILINNAGRGYDCPLEYTDINEFRKLFELNVVGPLVAMQSVIPLMKKQGGGMIVNISSGTALMYLPDMSAYSSTKRALNGLTLTAREELSKDRIIVSVVYPYITKTDFDKNMVKSKNYEAPSTEEDNNNRPPADSAEYVAEKILEVIKSEQAEQFVHDWMKKMH